MKQMKKILTFLLLGLFMISFASALRTHEKGVDLGISFSDTIAEGCNISTLVMPNGSVVWIGEEMIKIGNTFSSLILGGNFSEYGDTCINIECIDGYGDVCRNITETGEEFTMSIAILYSFLLILFGVFLYFTIYGIRNAESPEWLIGYICLSYVILYLVISVLWILSKNYLFTFPMLGNVLFMVWLIMGFGFLPFIFVISLYILGKEAKAALEKDLLKQGYSREDAKELSKKHK